MEAIWASLKRRVAQEPGMILGEVSDPPSFCAYLDDPEGLGEAQRSWREEICRAARITSNDQLYYWLETGELNGVA